MKRRPSHSGFTLIELLVSVSIFSIMGLAIASYITQIYRKLGVEVRAAIASQEVNNAVALLASELHMGASVSPYLTGNDPTIVNCVGSISTTSTTIRFLVVYDDATAVSGIRSYYVGYQYDPATRILYRGEVQAPSTTACTLPASDPLSNANRQILAQRIVTVGASPIFSYASPVLTLNLGIQVDGAGGITATQNISTSIFTRAA